MADYGFAMIATDLSFAPGAGTRDQVEATLKSLGVIDCRCPLTHPTSATVKWAIGPDAGTYVRGNPKEISVYVGEPSPFFDGSVVVQTTFILETTDGDPTPLQPVLEHLLQTSLAVRPFRI